MDELRVIRRDDQSLIVVDEAGTEYRLVIDSTMLAELRHLSRPTNTAKRVVPREIQALIRAGKTRAEVIEITGADDLDIDRYEEPVLAERRHILATAQRVAVRTAAADQQNQQFGQVIAERLISLGADDADWSAWRDPEAGWMIGLNFTTENADHHAVWSFEHRKNVLSPLTPDAVNLSKIGDVGDKLIPTLRAVENTADKTNLNTKDLKDLAPINSNSTALSLDTASSLDTAPVLKPVPAREDSDTDQADTTAALNTEPAGTDKTTSKPVFSAGTEAAMRAGHPSTGSIPVVDPIAEFERRREIDQLAIKTSEPELPDLGQTADLLDALRKRRDDYKHDTTAQQQDDFGTPILPPQNTASPNQSENPDTAQSSQVTPISSPKGRGKGRTSIPSWDDILFGTRGEDDDPTPA